MSPLKKQPNKLLCAVCIVYLFLATGTIKIVVAAMLLFLFPGCRRNML